MLVDTWGAGADTNEWSVQNYTFGNTPAWPTWYLDRTIDWISGSPNNYVYFRHEFIGLSNPSTQCIGTPRLDMGGVVGALLDNGTWNWTPTYGYGGS